MKIFFLIKEEYNDRLQQGYSCAFNMRRLRANAGDKSTSDASEVALAAAGS